MAKVAKLVRVTLITRIIVEEGTTREKILETARRNFIDSINNDLSENVDSIENDTECPFSSDDIV